MIEYNGTIIDTEGLKVVERLKDGYGLSLRYLATEYISVLTKTQEQEDKLYEAVKKEMMDRARI